MNIFTGWLRRSYLHRLTYRAPVPAIPEDTAVLCESCHHFVSISGFIPHLSGHSNTCPYCTSNDQDKLKFAAAWIRTEEEQRLHWEGRKTRTGKVTAINGGVPKPLPPKINPLVGSWK